MQALKEEESRQQGQRRKKVGSKVGVREIGGMEAGRQEGLYPTEAIS